MIAFLLLCSFLQGVAAESSGQCNPSSSRELEDNNALIQGHVKISMQQVAAPRVEQTLGNSATDDKVLPASHVPGSSDRIASQSSSIGTKLVQVLGLEESLPFLLSVTEAVSRPLQIQVAIVSVGVGLILLSVMLFGLAHFVNLILFVLYIGWSSAILFVNRSLVHRHVFVHPIVLVTVHMFTCMVLTRGLFFLKPQWLPGLQQMEKQTKEQQNEIWRAVYLIAAFFAMSLVSENSAYFYSAVALLQMVKEAGLLCVVLFSIMFGLDVFSLRRHPLLVLVILGAIMCVDGEVHFTIWGPLLQMTSNVANGMRLTLQNKLMSSCENVKLDPLSYTGLVSPFCFLALLVPAAVTCYTHQDVFAAVWQARGMVFLSCLLAVGINLLVAALVQRVNAVGFCLLGAVKNATVITYSFLVLGQETTALQVIGCAVIFSSATMYTIVKEWERKPDTDPKLDSPTWLDSPKLEDTQAGQSNPQSG